MLRPLDRLRGRPFVFLHLLERAHKVKRTFDHPLPAFAASAVEYPIEVCQSLLAPPMPPARYLLSVGLFDSEWGYRWPLTSAGQDLGEREYAIATVVVPRRDVSNGVEFRGGWGPATHIGDRQIVVRRTIARNASLFIARSAAERLRIVIRANGRAVVTNTCDGERRDLAAGEHVVVVRACEGGEVQLRGAMSVDSVAWLSGSSRTRS